MKIVTIGEIVRELAQTLPTTDSQSQNNPVHIIIPVYTTYNPHNLITTNPVNNVAIEAHKDRIPVHTTYNLHNLITANPVNNVTIEAHNDDDINNIICYYTNVQSLPNK